MRKRLSMLLSAVLCLTLLLPAPVSAAEESVPQTLRYGGNDYALISGNFSQMSYQTGTAYIFAVKSGENYYALGADLNAVALTLQDGVLSAGGGVAEVTPDDSGNEYHHSFKESLPAKIGDKYLTITGLNGPLALSAEKSFVWHFSSVGVYTDPLACFYGSISDSDTAVSGCLTFQDGKFGTTTWGNMNEGNLCIYQRVCPHAHLESHAEKAAACLTGGNAAYGFCPDCGSYLNEEGEYLYTTNGYVQQYSQDFFVRYATGHRYVDGVCTNDPSHIALEYEPVTKDANLFEDGYLYIIAAPTEGNNWKVMGFNPQGEDPLYPGPGQGCTAVMGRDGKLRIDNANDGTWSAAEFRVSRYPDDAHMVITVPQNWTYEDYNQYFDEEGNNPYYGLWMPDNGSQVCVPHTDSGYLLADNAWRPIFDPSETTVPNHPYAVLVRPDGIAEIRMLTFTMFIPPITYGKTSVYVSEDNPKQEVTCFYAPGFSSDPIDGSGEPNVRLFRAKAPEKYAVNTQIAGSAMRVNILSDGEQNAVLAVCGYDGEGRLVSYEAEDVTLTAGTVSEQVPVGDAAEYRVFLLDAGTYLPLNVKQYKQDA